MFCNGWREARIPLSSSVRANTPRGFWARRSEWRELLELIPTLVYVRDPGEGTIVFANDALVRFTGRSEASILATGAGVFEEFVHPDDFASLGDLSSSLPLSGDGRDIRARNGRGEWRIISIREQELSAGLLPRGFVLGLATDVTERRRDAEALKESHAFTRHIADAGPTLVSVFDGSATRLTFVRRFPPLRCERRAIRRCLFDR